MHIFPAIDLFGGKAVRLFKGDYNQMTVYSDNPLNVARDFEQCGAQYLHVVDLEGAKSGGTPNIETIKNIIQNTNLFVEVGGGKGWTEKSAYSGMDFCKRMQDLGIKTIICTDISKDGAMKGTNLALYKTLSESLSLNLIASGGVSDISDVENLSAMGIYGAIIGKAYYTGAIDLKQAIEVAKQ